MQIVLCTTDAIRVSLHLKPELWVTLKILGHAIEYGPRRFIEISRIKVEENSMRNSNTSFFKCAYDLSPC
jgi:hypothetical protein